MNKTFLGDAALNSVQNAIARKKIKDLESNKLYYSFIYFKILVKWENESVCSCNRY